MVMGVWQGTITDSAGNVVPNPSITVQLEVSGLPPAACFADKDGAVALGSAFTANDANGSNNGYVRFYAVGGFYRITATSGSFSHTWQDVPIGTAAGTDASVVPSEGDVSGPDGGVVDGQLAVFSGTTGKALAGADLEGSPPTPVMVGSDADVRAATPGKVIHAGHIESASAFVGLTDDTTVAVDWDSFVNATLELTTNRVLGNPTNGQPGTWRTIYVTSDGGPDTLTFGNQYIGPAIDGDALDDIAMAAKAYLLTILCITTSLFFVAAAPVELA